MEASYVTTLRRRVASVFLGTLIGAAVTAIPAVFLLSDRGRLTIEAVSMGVIGSLLGWLLGIVLLGLPVWLICERQTWGSRPRVAAICGAVLSPLWFLAFIALVQVIVLDHSEDGPDSSFLVWIAAIVSAVPLAGLGVGVALAMWRLAYRREIKPRVEDVFS